MSNRKTGEERGKRVGKRWEEKEMRRSSRKNSWIKKRRCKGIIRG
jgi:hypothetical protein